MATISELLLQLNQTKAKIVNNLEAKGVKITEEDTFADIGDKIQTIAENEITSLVGFIEGQIQMLTVPNGVTSLRDGLMTNDTNLTTVYLPETIQNIPTNCFEGCTNLQKIFINKDGEGKYASDGTLTLPNKLWGTNAVVYWKNNEMFEAMFHELLMNMEKTQIGLDEQLVIELKDNGDSDTNMTVNFEGMEYTINDTSNVNIISQDATQIVFTWKEGATTKSLFVTVTVTDTSSNVHSINFTTDDSNASTLLELVLSDALWKLDITEACDEYKNIDVDGTVKEMYVEVYKQSKYYILDVGDRDRQYFTKANITQDILEDDGFRVEILNDYTLNVWQGLEQLGLVPELLYTTNLKK